MDDPYNDTVEWWHTYEYAAKHRSPVENKFECPCELCPGKVGRHRDNG